MVQGYLGINTTVKSEKSKKLENKMIKIDLGDF